MSLVTCFALPVFAGNKGVSGYALDYDGNRANFGSSHSQSTYTSDYVSGVYKYACANFSVYSNDGGSNTIYANTMR